MTLSGLKSRLPAVFGTLIFLALWEGIARTGWLGPSLPALSDVAAVFERPAVRDLFLRALRVTAGSAGLALLTGAVIAIGLALLGSLMPPLQRGLDVLSSGIYAIPAIAFGPVLILLAGPEWTPMLLGTVSAFFPIHVALGSQLRYDNPARRDFARVVGASRARVFAFVDVPAAVPAFLDGLRLAAPAAVLGVVLGEWFGAPRGLGVIIISALQNIRIPHLWAAALLCVACSLLAYVLLTLTHRRAVARFSV